MFIIKNIKKWIIEAKKRKCEKILYQMSGEILDRIDQYRFDGQSEEDIATSFGCKSIEEYSKMQAQSFEFMKYYDAMKIVRMRKRGYSYERISKVMNMTEDAMRCLLEDVQKNWNNEEIWGKWNGAHLIQRR